MGIRVFFCNSLLEGSEKKRKRDEIRPRVTLKNMQVSGD